MGVETVRATDATMTPELALTGDSGVPRGNVIVGDSPAVATHSASAATSALPQRHDGLRPQPPHAADRGSAGARGRVASYFCVIEVEEEQLFGYRLLPAPPAHYDREVMMVTINVTIAAVSVRAATLYSLSSRLAARLSLASASAAACRRTWRIRSSLASASSAASRRSSRVSDTALSSAKLARTFVDDTIARVAM